MNGGQALGWICDNQGWIGPILAVIIPASLLSGVADKLPPWLGNLLHFLAGNWVVLARILLNPQNPPASAAVKKQE